MTGTFQQALDFGQLAGIVEFPEVFRLLGEVFPLNGRIALVCDNVGSGIVELGD